MSDQDVTSRVLFRVLLSVWIVGVLILGIAIYYGTQPVESQHAKLEPTESLDSLPLIIENFLSCPSPTPVPLEPLMWNPQVVASVRLASDRILEVYATEPPPNSRILHEQLTCAVWANIVDQKGSVLVQALEPMTFHDTCAPPCPRYWPCNFHVAEGDDRVGLAFQHSDYFYFFELRTDRPTIGPKVRVKRINGTIDVVRQHPGESREMPGDNPSQIRSDHRVLTLTDMEFDGEQWRTKFVNKDGTIKVELHRIRRGTWVE